MNFIFLSFVLIFNVTLSVGLHAQDYKEDCTEHIIKPTEIIKISSCDNSGWCKVKGKELYIKAFLFNKVDIKSYILHNNLHENGAYYHIRNKAGYVIESTYERCIAKKKKNKLRPSLVNSTNVIKQVDSEKIQATSEKKELVQEDALSEVTEDVVPESLQKIERASKEKEENTLEALSFTKYSPYEDQELLTKTFLSTQDKQVQSKNPLKREKRNYVSLIDVVVESLSISYKVKSAKEKMRRAQLTYEKAFADYYPTVDLSYSHTENDNSYFVERKNGINGQFHENKSYSEKSANITLQQNLYAGNATQNNIKRLYHKYSFEKYNYENTLQIEAEKAVRAYFDIVFRYKALNTNQKNIERLEKVLEIVQVKYDNGAATIGRLSSVKASISNAKTQLSNVESKFNKALDYYKFIVGDEFTDTFPFEEDVDIQIQDYEVLVQEMLNKNPKILSFQHNIIAENFKLAGQNSKFRPAVDLKLKYESLQDQEFYTGEESTYSANVVFKYNLYNGNRDQKEFLIINSKIEEMKHEKNFEVRKLKWDIDKLHTSLTSLEDTVKNTEDEIISTISMVESYWEGFKHGEQDLEILLQGQRQLNSAEINLIDSVHNSIKDYFSVLKASGTLLEYFNININKKEFLDFAKTTYRKSKSTIYSPAILNQDYENSLMQSDENMTIIYKEAVEDINLTSENIASIEKEEVVNEEVKDTVASFLAFNKEFLKANNKKYTIMIREFDSIAQAFSFMHAKNITDTTFPYGSFKDNKIKTYLSHGIFNTREEAEVILNQLSDTSQKYKVVLIGEVQRGYNLYNTMLLEKKIPMFTTNKAFQEYFIAAPKDFYTINVASFASMQEAGLFVRSNKLEEDTFTFRYGDNFEWVQVVYGVFSSYEEAQARLDSMDMIRLKYYPIIEKVQLKQDLYEKSNGR